MFFQNLFASYTMEINICRVQLPVQIDHGARKALKTKQTFHLKIHIFNPDTQNYSYNYYSIMPPQ